MATGTSSASAAARLRRTFKYPIDEDDGTDFSPDEMDEEEQEHLLSTLQASESSSNRTYTLILTGLPLATVFPFLRYLFSSTTTSMATLCALSSTSLLATAYIMYSIPISTTTTTTHTDSGSGSGRTPSSIFAPTASSSTTQPRLRLPSLLLLSDSIDTSGSPISRYLPTLNAAISTLLVLASMAYRSKSKRPDTDVPEGLWLFLLLPPVVFGMVYVAKRSMGEIQTGLSELQALRYEYKGA